MTSVFLMSHNYYHLYHFDLWFDYVSMCALHFKWCERVVPSFCFPCIKEVYSYVWQEEV